ncbi:MAG: hypothetical protein HY694_02835, partial [Deltaproteobacteria bacterium]|nr:hypothetical protein [Deltaproteobacteria bacterium]
MLTVGNRTYIWDVDNRMDSVTTGGCTVAPMITDELSNYYSDLLDGSYNCVDRVVLNAHFGLCYS